MLFDGMAVIQMLQPETSKKTYKDMANIFWKYIMSNSKGVKRVNVVFDRYVPNSIKSQTRTKRGDADTQLSCHIQSDIKIPEWKMALKNGRFKSNLSKFYTLFLAENAHILIGEDTSIIVSGGLEETALKMNHDKITSITDLKSNQEEADTRLLLHAKYEANNGSESVVIMSPDTDVLVLCVHHFEIIGLKTLYFKTGRKLAHTDSTRYIPIHTMHYSLSLMRETSCCKYTA